MTEIKYLEAPIDAVMQFFADSYESKDDKELKLVDYFFDTVKGKVVFKMTATGVKQP